MPDSTAHQRGLERVYLAAPTNRAYDPTIHVGSGEAEITFPVRPETFHGGGAVHGSVLFKALDDAAFFAVSSVVRDELVLTTSFHLHFLRPVRNGSIRAVGRVTSKSRRLLVGEAVAYDDRGRELARGSGTFLRSGMALDAVPGYSDPASDAPEG